MKTVLYPGTFDPVTNGHLDVLERASKMFDHVIISIAENTEKSPTFSSEERTQLVKENIARLNNVSVETFDGLLVEHARRRGACAVVRGLRAVSDFEYEFQMAQMNRHLDSEIETIFLMPNEKYFFTSSQLIKQVHSYGGDSTELVPPNVHRALMEQYDGKRPSS